MNPWFDLQRQSAALENWQLLLMLLFMLGYVGSIGRLLEARARLRAAALAAVSGALLCLLMAPWVLGALMLAAAVGAVGLFTAVVVLVSRLLGLDRPAAGAVSTPVADEAGTAPRGAPVRAAAPLTVH